MYFFHNNGTIFAIHVVSAFTALTRTDRIGYNTVVNNNNRRYNYMLAIIAILSDIPLYIAAFLESIREKLGL